MTEEDELILKIAKGSEAAFTKLFDKYGALILGYCMKYLEKEKAEEVSQEVWMRVIRFSSNYQSQGKALNWLYTIARNLCYSSLESVDLPLKDDLLSTPESSIEEDLVLKDDLKNIMKKVSTLPKVQKTCIMMFYIEEKSIEEIANYLSISLSLVKVNLFRAREKLKEVL